MNIHQHPERLDHLASAYALGTLRGGARRRLEQLAREYPNIRAAVWTWQGRLSGMTELQTAVTPDAAVWTRIHNLVKADQEAEAMAKVRTSPSQPHRQRWSALTFWRAATAATVLTAVVAGVVSWSEFRHYGREVLSLQAQLQSQAKVDRVAVLSDHNGPALLATYDSTHQRLTLRRVGDYVEADDRSLQLWAVRMGETPHSLGVLERADTTVIATATDTLSQVPTLAVSLEPRGGVAGEKGPTGPVLFNGALLRATL